MRGVLAVPAMCGVVIAGCATALPPVEVTGSLTEILSLNGEWSGEYRADDGARSGSIFFVLDADRDVAHGDVVMSSEAPEGAWSRASAAYPPVTGEQPGAQAFPMPRTEALRISFVRAENGRVTGLMDAYRDPDCGCRLWTTFTGVRRGDVIVGTYATRHIDTGTVSTGHWRAERRHP